MCVRVPYHHHELAVHPLLYVCVRVCACACVCVCAYCANLWGGSCVDSDISEGEFQTQLCFTSLISFSNSGVIQFVLFLLDLGHFFCVPGG